MEGFSFQFWRVS